MAGQRFLTLPRTTGAERRKAARHRRGATTTWRPFGKQTSAWGAAAIWDLSTTGLGLVLSTPPSDKYLDVTLEAVPGAPPLPPRVVRVRRVVRRSDGNWLVGCTFVRPLANEDLQNVL